MINETQSQTQEMNWKGLDLMKWPRSLLFVAWIFITKVSWQRRSQKHDMFIDVSAKVGFNTLDSHFFPSLSQSSLLDITTDQISEKVFFTPLIWVQL
jgi:hypothetical protein